MTKPTKIATGIAAGGAACAAIAIAETGLARLVSAWTALACVVACGAYLWNRPAWLGKRGGRLSLRALAVLPYLAAVRIACALIRFARGRDAPTRVAPGILVAGRIGPGDLGPGTTHVVDLVAEYPAHPAIRRLAGYRSLPVLDGGHPGDVAAFLALVRELVPIATDVLVHCDSGRGRAPTLAAALLVARGLAPDVDAAIVHIRTIRPVAAPTRSDRAFLATIAPALAAIAREHESPGGRAASVRRVGA